jgi:predicted dehydrogenase
MAGLGSSESSGGALLCLGSHLVDMLLWLVGDDVTEVPAASAAAPTPTILRRSLFRAMAVAQCQWIGQHQGSSSGWMSLAIPGWSCCVWHSFAIWIEVTSTVNVAYSQLNVIKAFHRERPRHGDAGARTARARLCHWRRGDTDCHGCRWAARSPSARRGRGGRSPRLVKIK